MKTPLGLVIHHANPVAGWTSPSTDATVRRGPAGRCAPSKERFAILLKADVDPGLVQLDAKQLYDDGNVVSWPVQITVLPAAKSPRQNLALAGVVALIGLLTIAAIFMLARRRPQRPRAAG